MRFYVFFKFIRTFVVNGFRLVINFAVFKDFTDVITEVFSVFVFTIVQFLFYSFEIYRFFNN